MPISCDNAYFENQQAHLLIIPQSRVNLYILSLPYDHLTFSLENHEGPRLETGKSERRITCDLPNSTPEKCLNSFDPTNVAYTDSYSTYELSDRSFLQTTKQNSYTID